MSSLPKVSVLIPMYNAEKFIGETLESVLNQTYKNIEIIIVDDESSDNSYEVAQKYCDKNKNIILSQQKNQGPGAARNKAFSLSSGEYIQYLDADDLLAPDKIELQIDELQKHHDNIFVFGSVAEFKVNTDNAYFQNFYYFKDYNDPINFLADYWGTGGMIQIASLLIPRKSVLKAGKWNEDWILNEDGEFISRIIKESNKVVYLNNAVSYYRKDNTGSLNSQRTEKHYRSQLESYSSYYKMYKQKFPGSDRLRIALAKRYSRVIFNMYPNYDLLMKKAEEQLCLLGYKQPIPVGSKKFVLLAKCIGIYNALFIQHWTRKFFQK